MNKAILSSLALSQMLLSIALAPVAYAQVTNPSIVPPRPTGAFGEIVVQEYQAPARDLPTTIRFIINFILGLAGILALAVLVYGGFVYITSAGNEDRVEQAKAIITNAVIGLIVIGIAAAVVNFFIGSVLFIPSTPAVPAT